MFARFKQVNKTRLKKIQGVVPGLTPENPKKTKIIRKCLVFFCHEYLTKIIFVRSIKPHKKFSIPNILIKIQNKIG